MLMAQGWTPPRPPQPPMQPQSGMAPPGMPPRPPMPQGPAPLPAGSGPAAQGTPQGGPQIPPQMLQMLMQRMQQQAPQQLAAQGRNGDSLIAHLTPGEIQVPPQVQTPKVLATLKHAFEEKKVSPSQFMAGSPQSSVNPSTGVPEYNFMSAFLPAALGVAGAAAAPFTGGASLGLSTAALAALGGGLGTAAGGLLTGQTPTQAALGGLGSAAGGYALGSLGGSALSSASGAGGSAAGSALPGTGVAALNTNALSGSFDPASQFSGNALSSLPSASAASAGSGAASGASPIMGSQMLGNAVSNFSPMRSAGSALGGYIGTQLGAPPTSNAPNYPSGFNTPMPAVGSLGSAQQQLGMTSSVQPRPSFTGYNPATNNPAAYNFYPNSQ